MTPLYDNHRKEIVLEKSDWDKILYPPTGHPEYRGEVCRVEDWTSCPNHLGVKFEFGGKTEYFPGEWVEDRYRELTADELQAATVEAIDGNDPEMTVALLDAYKNKITAPALNEIERVVA